MRRREFIVLAGGAAATWPLAARAQQPVGKVPRVGYLGLTSAFDGAQTIKVVDTAFRDLGFVMGQSLVIEYRWADGQHERLNTLAAELVQLPVDVILAPTTGAALAARNATTTIPIVFATVSGPVELGLVASLARPGGNATGLTYYVSPELVGKQLELLREIRTGFSRIAILWNPSNAGAAQLLAEARTIAKLQGMQLRVFEARGPDEFERAYRAIMGEPADGLLVLPDPLLTEHRAALGSLALKTGLPSMFGSREDLAEGGLMAYGATRFDLIRRATGYVERILRGAKPTDLPVEQPARFELVINLKTARALGLTIPEAILARADEIIE